MLKCSIFFPQNLTLTPYPVGYDPKKKRKPPNRQPPPVDEIEENPSPGTFSMAKLMARMRVVSSVSKDYTIAEWKNFCNDKNNVYSIWSSENGSLVLLKVMFRIFGHQKIAVW